MLSKNKIIILLLVFVLSATGCDMINSIKEYFSKSKDKAPVAESAVSTQDVSENVEPAAEVAGSMSEDTLARVGKWSVTIDQFNDRLKAVKEIAPEYNVDDPQAKELILDELIKQQLLVIDAENQGLDKKKDVQDAIEEFRRTVLVREMANKLTEGVDVTEAEAKAFYEENKAVIVDPAELRVSEIKIDTEDKAKAILVELLQGADFAEIAKQKSMATTATNGGDLGFLKELPFAEMGAPLQSLTVGQTSGVFKGPDGFYVIKLVEKKGGNPLAYDDVKNDIIQNRKLFKQQQILLDYIKTLEEKTKVEVNKSLIQKGK